MSKEKRLGRGLEALLGRVPASVDAPIAGRVEEDTPAASPSLDQSDLPPSDMLSPETSAAGAETEPSVGLLRLDVEKIDRGSAQPREQFDSGAIRALAASIATHGLMQPIVVRKVDDRYELIAGERRLRAAREAGWSDVPANIVEADDRHAAELAIVENLQRKDLNPLEKAASFQRYLELYGCTQEELAGRLNMDRSTVANMIRLLELPAPVQQALRQAKITQGHARALLPLGEEREQIAFCERIGREGLNVRQTEAAVQEAIETADGGDLAVIDRDGKKTRPTRNRSEHLAALEQELRAALGCKVTITHNARGRGKMVIHFRNHDEFERLRNHLTDDDHAHPESYAG